MASLHQSNTFEKVKKAVWKGRIGFRTKSDRARILALSDQGFKIIVIKMLSALTEKVDNM